MSNNFVIKANISFKENVKRLETSLKEMRYSHSRMSDVAALQKSLAGVLRDVLPDIDYLAKKIKKELKYGAQFCIVNDLNFEHLKNEERKLFMLGLCGILGELSHKDKNGSDIIRRVKYDKNATTQIREKIFSRGNGFVDFHTDNAFMNIPPNAFSLWCEMNDPSGGMTILVKVEDVIYQLLQEESGHSILSTLCRDYPLLDDDEESIFYSPIIRKDQEKYYIRYRKYVIEQGLLLSGVSDLSEQKIAFSRLDNIIKKIEPIKISLLPGQAIFINNCTVLHGRTAFTDAARSLLRVRFNIN